MKKLSKEQIKKLFNKKLQNEALYKLRSYIRKNFLIYDKQHNQFLSSINVFILLNEEYLQLQEYIPLGQKINYKIVVRLIFKNIFFDSLKVKNLKIENIKLSNKISLLSNSFIENYTSKLHSDILEEIYNHEKPNLIYLLPTFYKSTNSYNSYREAKTLSLKIINEIYKPLILQGETFDRISK